MHLINIAARVALVENTAGPAFSSKDLKALHNKAANLVEDCREADGASWNSPLGKYHNQLMEDCFHRVTEAMGWGRPRVQIDDWESEIVLHEFDHLAMEPGYNLISKLKDQSKKNKIDQHFDEVAVRHIKGLENLNEGYNELNFAYIFDGMHRMKTVDFIEHGKTLQPTGTYRRQLWNNYLREVELTGEEYAKDSTADVEDIIEKYDPHLDPLAREIEEGFIKMYRLIVFHFGKLKTTIEAQMARKAAELGVEYRVSSEPWEADDV